MAKQKKPKITTFVVTGVDKDDNLIIKRSKSTKEDLRRIAKLRKKK